jgi:hypothetical protein
LAQHAPNVPDAILHYEVLAPPDLERIFGLEGGSIFQGEQGLDQMAFMRPTPELARYATPVHGLYLCGAGTHPGRRRHRRLGPQRGAPRAARPARGADPNAPAPSRSGRPRLNGHSVHIGSPDGRSVVAMLDNGLPSRIVVVLL